MDRRRGKTVAGQQICICSECFPSTFQVETRGKYTSNILNISNSSTLEHVAIYSHYPFNSIMTWGFDIRHLAHLARGLYGPEEERDFIRDHLGPELEKSGHLDPMSLLG